MTLSHILKGLLCYFLSSSFGLRCGLFLSALVSPVCLYFSCRTPPCSAGSGFWWGYFKLSIVLGSAARRGFFFRAETQIYLLAVTHIVHGSLISGDHIAAFCKRYFLHGCRTTPENLLDSIYNIKRGSIAQAMGHILPVSVSIKQFPPQNSFRYLQAAAKI